MKPDLDQIFFGPRAALTGVLAHLRPTSLRFSGDDRLGCFKIGFRPEPESSDEVVESRCKLVDSLRQSNDSMPE